MSISIRPNLLLLLLPVHRDPSSSLLPLGSGRRSGGPASALGGGVGSPSRTLSTGMHSDVEEHVKQPQHSYRAATAVCMKS